MCARRSPRAGIIYHIIRTFIIVCQLGKRSRALACPHILNAMCVCVPLRASHDHLARAVCVCVCLYTCGHANMCVCMCARASNIRDLSHRQVHKTNAIAARAFIAPSQRRDSEATMRTHTHKTRDHSTAIAQGGWKICLLCACAPRALAAHDHEQRADNKRVCAHPLIRTCARARMVRRGVVVVHTQI